MASKKIKGAIIGNVVLLSLSLVLLVTMSFAWFDLSDTTNANQSVNIGKFVVSLDDDTTAYAESKKVEIDNTFPMTFDYANTNSATLKNIYAFEIENSGTISAMIRLVPKIVSEKEGDAGTKDAAKFKAIKEQIRYSVKTYTNTATPGTFAEIKTEGKTHFLFDGTANADTNISLAEYLETLTLKEDAADSAKLIAKDDAIVAASGKLYFDILVWLDESATVQSTNANSVTERPGFVFAIDMFAMQSGGGAYFAK